MKIVALDFETANKYNESACSLGICIYEEGVIVDHFEWYIKPHSRYADFTNSHIHHIYYSDVVNAPSFLDYYPKLSSILEDAIIIAHNARFDMGVLNSLCRLYGLDLFKNYYFDTVQFARKVYLNLDNYKLNTVSRFLEIDLNHHNAKSDAFACMMIVLKAMENFNEYDILQLLKQLNIPLRQHM